MAKKNLASLMSGIMGEREDEDLSINVENSPKSDLHSSVEENTPSPSEESKPAEKRKPGRPKKSETTKIEEIRVTFIANSEQMRQIKYISLVQGKLLKEVLADAIADYVSAWEADNGRIKLPSRK